MAATDLGVIVGVKIYASSTLPATYDQSGYEALSFTEISEITDINEFGRSWDKVEHMRLSSGAKVKFKSFYDEGQLTLPLARSESDTGQTMMETAVNEQNKAYAFKIEYESGGIVYFSGQVFGFTDGNVNTMRGGTLTVELDGDTVVKVDGTTTYTLTYETDGNGTIIGDATQTVVDGGNGTAVFANSNTGFTFDQWSDGSTDNPRTDTAVTGDLTVTANFV